MAIVANVPPPSLLPRVLAALEAEVAAQAFHFDTGLLGNYFLTKVLSHPSIARDDLLYAMITATGPPSYSAIFNKGRTTFCEDWFCETPPTQFPSNAHSTLLGPALWVSQGILGVKPLPELPRGGGGGGRGLTVRPSFGVGGLSSASGTTWTPLGAVKVEWSVVRWGNDNQNRSGAGESNTTTRVTLALDVPGNAVVFLWLPADGPGGVSEGGVPATGAVGVQFSRQEGNFTVWAVGSGNFYFTAISTTSPGR